MQPPLRPIVSSIGAYNYNLAKYLSSLLVPLLPDTYSVKDSFSFVEELRSFDFNDKFLISFDVESLFTNIPLNETIDIAVHLIFKHNPKFSIKKTDLKKLFSFATSETHFLFSVLLRSAIKLALSELSLTELIKSTTLLPVFKTT